MKSPVRVQVLAEGVAVGWVLAEGCRAGGSPPGLAEALDAAVAAASGETPEREARKAAVRNLLRHGAYKPTGRGKPASEYLLNAALEGRFPRINALVDVNNLVSLEALLPVSMVDLGLAATREFSVRWGREGESYVFNPSGQVLELRDLLLAARLPGDAPCASPVKDSQATKTHEGTRAVLALVYAPASLADEAFRAAARLAELLTAHVGAAAESGMESRAG